MGKLSGFVNGVFEGGNQARKGVESVKLSVVAYTVCSRGISLLADVSFL